MSIHTHKTLYNTPLSNLTPYAEEITGDHQCEFRHIMPTTGHMIFILPTVEKKLV
jgi:hypothetical protein